MGSFLRTCQRIVFVGRVRVREGDIENVPTLLVASVKLYHDQ